MSPKGFNPQTNGFTGVTRTPKDFGSKYRITPPVQTPLKEK